MHGNIGPFVARGADAKGRPVATSESVANCAHRPEREAKARRRREIARLLRPSCHAHAGLEGIPFALGPPFRSVPRWRPFTLPDTPATLSRSAWLVFRNVIVVPLWGLVSLGTLLMIARALGG